jgi:HEAT repeat protein
MGEIHIHGNVENSNIVQGDHNTLSLGAPALSAARQKELTERYLRSLTEEWQFLTVSVHGEDRCLSLERVFFMLQARERPEAKLTELPRPDLDPATARFQDAGAPPAPKPPPPPVPLETVLGKGENLVLLGEPGAGKSTALQFIGLCFARAAENWHVERLKVNRAYIPIRLDLQTSAASIAANEVLIDVLRAEVRGRLQCSPAEAEALLEAWKTSPGLLVLFDGLDEVPADLRETVRRRIETFAHSGAAWVILTSRPAGFQSLPGLNEYTLKPFEHPETEALPYLRGWLAVLKPEWTAEQAESEARTLLEKMQARPALRRLLDNPLLLRLSAQHYALSGEIARNRADLYRLWVEEAWQRATRRGAKEEEKRHFLQALEALAWHLHLGGGNEEADLLQALQRFGLARDETAAADLLRRLREQSGLLARLPQSEEGKVRLRYAFSHQTLREYFVALRLQRAWKQDARRTWRFLKPRLHLPEWREPLALLVSALPEGEALRLLNGILRARSPEERFLRRDLFLAAELAGESGHAEAMWERLEPHMCQALKDRDWQVRRATEALGKIGSPAVPALIQALNDDEWRVRWAAAQALGKIGNPQAVPALIQALKDENEWVRLAAAWTLGKIGSPAIPTLLEVLKDKDWRMRQAAAEVLGKIGDPQAVPALIEALKDEDRRVRLVAAEALGKMGLPAIPPLIQALKDRDEDARLAAAWVLGKIGDPQAVLALLEALKDDKDEWVRYQMKEALVEIGMPAVPALLEALKGEDVRDVRQAAAEVLGEIGDPRAVPALLEALKDEDVRDVRRAAALALGEIGDPRAVPALLEAIKDEDVYWAAARALGKIGDPRAVPALLEALKDQRMRLSATEALGKIGDPQALPALLEALKDKDWGVRRAAAEALGEFCDPQAAPALMEALEDEVEWVRYAAAKALERIPKRQAIPTLIQALKNEKSWVRDMAVVALKGELWERQRAVEILGEIGSPAVPVLLEALKDEDLKVRWLAAQALGKIGDPRAVPALLEALKDQWMRLSATEALGKIGDPQAVPALLEALKDENKWIRKAAVSALGEIGDRQALPALMEALKDRDENVRRAAAEALGEIGDRQALLALMEALKDEDKWMRYAAAEALGEIGDRQALPALVEALKDWYGDVRRAAAEALWKLLLASPPQNQEERRPWQKRLVAIQRVARREKNYELLTAVLERQAAWQAALSPWQDPLQPPPLAAWARAARWAGRGLALVFLAALLAVIGVLLAGAQDVLKEAVLPYLQSQPLAVVVLILVGAAAILVIGEWVREKMVR